MSRQNRTVLRALAVLGPVKSRDFKPDACRNAAPDHMLERARSEVFCACRREKGTSRCSRMRTLTEKRSLPDSYNVAVGPDNIQAMSSTLLQVCLRGTCSSSICEPANSGAIMLPRTMAKQGPGPSIACPWSVVRYNLAACHLMHTDGAATRDVISGKSTSLSALGRRTLERRQASPSSAST